MYHDFTYPGVLAASARAAWQLDDVMPEDAELDFSRPFMPEALARVGETPGVTPGERLLLNQIRGHEYLRMFGLIEEMILPFVLDHARSRLADDDARVRAMLGFASEEAKHIHLFKRFHAAFVRGFPIECEMIGPAEAIGAEILRHDPLSVAMAVLHIEWMTQAHYLDSVRDDAELDPLFKSLLRHHWMEEAQHAKIDTLMVEGLAEGRDAAAIDRAVDEYLEIGMFLDGGCKAQAALNLAAFEAVSGHVLDDVDREAFLAVQHQALRRTYLGSGMTHPRFRATIGAVSPAALARIDAVAPAFC
ncbi:MAG TPA: diiron oxygenase [Sphingomonas sp.]|nr:diiron oxygenase [Sphingomonas sp.]